MSNRGLEMPDRETPLMRIRIWSILVVAVVVLVGASRAGAQTPPPVIFFTDLQSGPNSGGETIGGFSGAYVTLYGNSFGATQGSSTVTLNGSSCLRVVSWGTLVPENRCAGWVELHKRECRRYHLGGSEQPGGLHGASREYLLHIDHWKRQ
jgi:hypothetical protein